MGYMALVFTSILVLHYGLACSGQAYSMHQEEERGASDERERELEFLSWVDRVVKGEHLKLPSSHNSSRSSSSSGSSSDLHGLVKDHAGGDDEEEDEGDGDSGDVVVSTQRVVTVDKSGNGQFMSVQEAVDSIPKKNRERTIVHIAAGVYEEKVKVPKTKPYVTFQGEGMEETKITWHDNANSAGTTLKSASVTVMAPYFVARDITFENTSPAPDPGQTGMQAVAFQISGDKSAFYNCGFLGAQDTLYDHYGKHYFKDCYIQGSIDFIFGDGLSLYEGCKLKVLGTSLGSLTAQKRKTASENTGFSFVNCQVEGSDGGDVYLGRAWGPYSRVVFITTWLDKMIIPRGWYDWGVSARQETVFYGEYNCSGPGADRDDRVPWSVQLTETQADSFKSISFIEGQAWLQ